MCVDYCLCVFWLIVLYCVGWLFGFLFLVDFVLFCWVKNIVVKSIVYWLVAVVGSFVAFCLRARCGVFVVWGF